MGMGQRVLATMIFCAAACAPSGPPKLGSEGGASWIELTSPHFILRTDLDQAGAQTLIKEFEQIDDALEQAAFPRSSAIPNRILVVCFATQSEFEAFGHLNEGGFAAWKLPNDLEEQSTIVIWGAMDASHPMMRIAFSHELTHQLIHESFGGAPLWMNEGLAQYFSSTIVENGTVTLGDLPFGQTLPQPVASIPSAEAIATADRIEFYAGVSYQQTTEDRALKTGVFYEGSWWLVHMLRNGPPDVTWRFDKVIDAADRGESLADAWSRIMVPNGYAWLNAKFHEYMTTTDHLTLLRAPYRAHASNATLFQRKMSEVETRLLWARLVDWKNEEGNRGLVQLAVAANLDPTSPEVLYWRALALLKRRELDGAIELFTEAIAKVPNEPRYLLGLGVAQIQRYSDHKSPDAKAAIAVTAGMLEPIATSATQLAFVAAWYSSKRQRDRGAELADRAMKINPSCVECVSVRARIAFDDGSLEDAVRLERRAIALLPEGANDRPFQTTLAAYEAALKAKAVATPQAPSTTSSPLTPN
jgi:tetratricopeptide (TPR) repeat protein